MNGLQTIQKLNDAATALAEAASKTKVSDVVDGFFVFEPHGYQVIYHTADKLPTAVRPHFTVDFKGDAGNDPRFDVTPATGSPQCNRSLAEVVQLAAGAGLDGSEVAGRLGRLFANVSRN
jgi:hypothetical protein